MSNSIAIVLQITPLPDDIEEALRREYRLVRLPASQADLESFYTSKAHEVRGIATTGKGPIDAELLQRLPKLEIIASYSAGLDGIDTAAAARLGIPVTNTSAALADDVADVAIALILGVARRICDADRWVRAGSWPGGNYPLGTTLRGSHLGIVGLGQIGREVARRAEALKMIVNYHGPNEKMDAPYRYVPDLHELAAHCQFLVITCPGGAATRRMIDAGVLQKLGPDGRLINVSRGSVVDEAALLAALRQKHIAGAGLDVFENEPHVAAALIADPRVVLLPHIASATTQTRALMGEMMLGALRDKLAPSLGVVGRDNDVREKQQSAPGYS